MMGQRRDTIAGKRWNGLGGLECPSTWTFTTRSTASPRKQSRAHMSRMSKVQEKHGVTYQKYWFDEGSGKAFCLVEAPSREAANSVHREAHGLVADELIEVQEGG